MTGQHKHDCRVTDCANFYTCSERDCRLDWTCPRHQDDELFAEIERMNQQQLDNQQGHKHETASGISR